MRFDVELATMFTVCFNNINCYVDFAILINVLSENVHDSLYLFIPFEMVGNVYAKWLSIDLCDSNFVELSFLFFLFHYALNDFKFLLIQIDFLILELQSYNGIYSWYVTLLVLYHVGGRRLFYEFRGGSSVLVGVESCVLTV